MPPTPMTAFVSVSLGGREARPAEDVAREDRQGGGRRGGAPGELAAGHPSGTGTRAAPLDGHGHYSDGRGKRREPRHPPAERTTWTAWKPRPFAAHYADLEARHLSELTFAEVRRALQALSSLYVERRERMAEGAVFDGAGKRAAFALYYGPMHFLLVREIVRALGPPAAPPPHPRPRLRHGHGGRGLGARVRAAGHGSRASTAAAGRSRRRGGPSPASASTAGRRAPTRRLRRCRSPRPASSPRSP